MSKIKSASFQSVSTRIDTTTAHDYCLQVITGLQLANTIYKSLKLYSIKSLPDILDMNRDDIKALEHPDKSGTPPTTLPWRSRLSTSHTSILPTS